MNHKILYSKKHGTRSTLKKKKDTNFFFPVRGKCHRKAHYHLTTAWRHVSLNQKNIPTCFKKKSSEQNPDNKQMKTQTFLWCRCLLAFFFPGRQLPAPTKSSWVITLLNRAMATLNRFTVKTRSLLNNFRPCFSE